MKQIHHPFVQIPYGGLAQYIETNLLKFIMLLQDIGHILYNIENDSGSSELSQIEKEVEQSFSKLSSIVQTLKDETVSKIVKLRTAEKESLENAKKSLADSIKNAIYVFNSVKKSLSVEKIKQVIHIYT